MRAKAFAFFASTTGQLLKAAQLSRSLERICPDRRSKLFFFRTVTGQELSAQLLACFQREFSDSVRIDSLHETGGTLAKAWLNSAHNAKVVKAARKSVGDWAKAERDSEKNVVVFKDNDPLNLAVLQESTNRHLRRILVEEGLGLFISATKRPNRLKRLAKWSAGLRTPDFLHIGGSQLYDTVLTTDLDLWKSAHGDGEAVEIQQLPHSPSRQLSFDIVRELLPKNARSHLDVDIIYVSQPLSESRMVSSEKELAFVAWVKNRTQAHGLTFLFKPHPRDAMRKVSRFLEQSDHLLAEIPFEVLWPLTHRPTFLSPFSTVVLEIFRSAPSRARVLFPMILDEPQQRENLRRLFASDAIIESEVELETFLRDVRHARDADRGTIPIESVAREENWEEVARGMLIPENTRKGEKGLEDITAER